MKRCFTLIAAMLITIGAFAAAQTRLSITTNSRYPVRILIDGSTFNNRDRSNDDDEVVINDLRAGYHNVKIYQQRPSSNRFNKNMQLIYDGNVYVKQQYHVDISINRFGKAFVDERLMNGAYFQENNENSGWNGNANNNGGWNGNYGSGNGGWNNGNGGWNGNSQAMDARSFEQFKRTLANESYDNSRVNIAKQTIAANQFTSAQVKELLMLFIYENYKLEIAKYSYAYTIDKANYFVVNDAFSYSSSKDELARYIQQRR